MAKLDPGLVAWLLTNVFDVKVPGYHHTRPHAPDVRVLVPRTYHADGVLVFCDPDDQPLLVVVPEVQRGWDATKRRTWKLYVVQLEAELNVSAALVAYYPNRRIADRYRDFVRLRRVESAAPAVDLGCRRRPGHDGRRS